MGHAARTIASGARAATEAYAVYFVDNRAFGIVGSYDGTRTALKAAKAASVEHPGYAHVVVADGRIVAGYERGRRLTAAA